MSQNYAPPDDHMRSERVVYDDPRFAQQPKQSIHTPFAITTISSLHDNCHYNFVCLCCR